MIRPLLFSLCVLTPGSALAALEVCNESGASVSVAVGYKADEGWTSEGWWNVDEGACKVVISGDLPRTHYYWRAESRSVGFDHESYMFCTEETEFTIIGDKDCDGRGYQRVGFNEIELDGATDFTLTLNAPAASKSASAAKAPMSDPEENTVYPDEGPQVDNGPGTFGEPLTISGRFEGCWAVNEDLECELHADGWVYIASEDGPTAPSVISALNSYDIGTFLQLSGDLMYSSGERVDIMVRDIALSEPPAAPPLAAGQMDGLMEFLQGTWEEDSGSGTAWMIEGNRLRWIHDANIAEEYAFELHPECAASYGAGPVIIGWPEYDPSMGPSCWLVRETGPRHLLVENMVEGGTQSFSYVE